MITDPKQFTCAPGFILVKVITDGNTFNTPKTVDDVTSLMGEVLVIGEQSLNIFGIAQTTRVNHGDIILFRFQFNNDELIIGFDKYPVIPFDAVRGVIS